MVLKTKIKKMYLINNNFNKRNELQSRKKLLNDVKTIMDLKRKLTIHYPLKPVYHNVIPLNIFQTWWTKENLTSSMFESVNSIRINNPKFHYYLFDDSDCRNFIQKNYNNDVLTTYDLLIPGAYKADLWRYCVLYKQGGIYLDIKYKPMNSFKFINLTEKEHWVLDADNNGIYNALIVVKPGNIILKRAIEKVVENVKNRFYGGSCLEPTGPAMLSTFFSVQDKDGLDMKHEFYFGNMNNRVIYFNNIPIFKSYDGYLNDYNSTKKTEHYSTLWSQRRIYH
jgi:mannosyltransferase OCH1-like enzyme